MLAAKLANLKQHSNQYTGKSGHPDLDDHSPPVSIPKAAEMFTVSTGNNQYGRNHPDLEVSTPPVSIPKAAEMFTVSTGNVSKAKLVQRDGFTARARTTGRR